MKKGTSYATKGMKKRIHEKKETNPPTKLCISGSTWSNGVLAPPNSCIKQHHDTTPFVQNEVE
jgi:hypothetical protein